MDEWTRDSVLVLRLWIERHDGVVRGRLLHDRSEAGVVAVGVDDILAAVEAAVAAFAAEQTD